MAFLDALASDEAQRRGGLGVMRLAEITGREKSQVSRALRGLEETGLVERDADTLEYRLGWRLYALAARTAHARLVEASGATLQELAETLGETVHLCTLQGHDVLTIFTVSPGGDAFRGADWEGRSVPAHCTSAGRVLLLDATPAQLHELIPEKVIADDTHPSHVRSVDQLWEVISLAREKGYATVVEEFQEGVAGASAPVRDFRGRIVAAINISAPAPSVADSLEAAAEETKAAARRVSALLGWQETRRDQVSFAKRPS